MKAAPYLVTLTWIAVAASSPTLFSPRQDGTQGTASASPGVASGNQIQVPVYVPVNVCGNTVSVIGLLNPNFGNTCVNKRHHDGQREKPETFKIEASSDHECGLYTFEVPGGVVMDICGHKVGPGQVKKKAFRCSKNDCVTFGSAS